MANTRKSATKSNSSIVPKKVEPEIVEVVKQERDLSHLKLDTSDVRLYQNTIATLENPKDMSYTAQIGKKQVTVTARVTEKVPFTLTASYNQTVKVKGVPQATEVDILSISITDKHLVTKPLSKLLLPETIQDNLPYFGLTTITSFVDLVLYKAIPYWVKNAKNIVRQDNQPPYWYIISLLWYQLRQDTTTAGTLSDSIKVNPFTEEELFVCMIRTAAEFPENHAVINALTRIPDKYDYLYDFVKEETANAKTLKALATLAKESEKQLEQIKSAESKAESKLDLPVVPNTAYNLEPWKIELLDHYIDYTDQYGSIEEGNALSMDVGEDERSQFNAFIQLINWAKENHDLAYEVGIIEAFLFNGFYLDGLDKNKLEQIVRDNYIHQELLPLPVETVENSDVDLFADKDEDEDEEEDTELDKKPTLSSRNRNKKKTTVPKSRVENN